MPSVGKICINFYKSKELHITAMKSQRMHTAEKMMDIFFRESCVYNGSIKTSRPAERGAVRKRR